MNFDLNGAEKYRWTLASMSVGYFLLAWFWIERGIRPTVFFGSVWIFMGLMTASAATYLVIHHAMSSRVEEEARVELRPVISFEMDSVAAHRHYPVPVRTKVHS